MTNESEYIDYATVRNALEDARERRGELSYEQQMALNHAMWAASTMRASVDTDPKVFSSLLEKLMAIEKLAAVPDIAAKIAEIIPVENYSVKAILASKRIPMDDGEIDEIVTIVRQEVGYEG